MSEHDDEYQRIESTAGILIFGIFRTLFSL